MGRSPAFMFVALSSCACAACRYASVLQRSSCMLGAKKLTEACRHAAARVNEGASASARARAFCRLAATLTSALSKIFFHWYLIVSTDLPSLKKLLPGSF